MNYLLKIVDKARNYPYGICATAWGEIRNCIEKQIPQKPVMKAMSGFDSEVASELCCPNCGESVINYWNKSVNPPHCMMCGQKLDWESEGKDDA